MACEEKGIEFKELLKKLTYININIFTFCKE